MAGIPFLSKILALAGISVKNQTDNKEVLINVSSGQTSGTTLTVDLPSISGQLLVASQAVLASEKGAINGVATLDAGGKIPSAQLPPLTITNTYVVSSEAAMLALSANVGDIAVRTDLNETYILQSLPASTLSNWIELLESSGVQSVNGLTGPAVVLGAAQVGAVAKIGDTMTGVLTMDPVSTGSGETGQIAFRELASNGIYSVTLRAPDALSDYVVLTLPSGHGSPGQILTTDGSGIMSWADAPVDSVTSVNGQTGVVVLTAASVGAVAKAGDTMSGALVMDPTGILAGQGGVIRFKELAANGSNFVALRAPDSVSADITFTLPGTDGTAGQCLITNGSGVWSWASFPADSVTSVNGKTGVVVLNSDDVAEGLNNKYFTDLRARAAAVINSTTGSETDQAASVSAMKAYVAAAAPVLSVNGKTGTVSLNSMDISESGTNLYFSDERAQTAAVVNSTTGSQTTQAPSVAAIKAYIASSSPVLSVNGFTGAVSLSTTNIPEGTNKYFTDALARSAAVLNNTSGVQTDQAASIYAMKAYIAASSPVLSVNGYTGAVSLTASDVGAVAKTGDTMTGVLTMAATGSLSGQTGAIRLKELAANGDNYIAIRAADDMASDITLTLPNNTGSSGYVLTTNGSGQLSWAAAVDSSLTARVEKLEASRGIYSGTLQSNQELDISGLVGASDAEYPIVQIYKLDAGVQLQVNVEFSFNPSTKTITFGEVIDGPIDAVIHVLALTQPYTTL